MDNLQRENGHIDIAHGIAEALTHTNLSAYESRVLWCIFRKTYGYQKKEDWIAISQIVEMTGLHKAHVSRTLKLLCLRNIVTKGGNKMGFNKYQSQWRELPKGVTTHHKLPKGVPRVTKGGNGGVPKGAGTSYKTFTNYVYNTNLRVEDARHAQRLFDFIKQYNPSFARKHPVEDFQTIERWAKDINMLYRIDHATDDQINLVIRWIFEDTCSDAVFWRKNILSGGKLREKYIALVGVMQSRIDARPKFVHI